MPDLPVGTVTFFFSDIEGSTKLLQRLGQDYRGVLDQHDRILRSAITAHNGVEIRTEGDSFFTVFTTAPDAVAACSDIQQKLDAATWPEGGAVRVRIGLHSGLAELGGADYIGLDVHRAARISSTGYGGQVVVSAATQALASGREFIDLGSHMLKDLEQAEQLFQLVVPGLPTSFPPLRTVDAPPSNVPTMATELLGRDEEMALLSERIGQHRLVTIVGPGGVGKTHLAITVASAVSPDFEAGVFFVDLAPISDPSLVVPAIAGRLGVDESEPAAMASALEPGSRLVLLDSLEQVIEAASSINGLLSASTDLKILATSQVPLHITGEDVFRLEPLKVVLEGSADGLAPAVELFGIRAASVDPSFSLADHEDDVAKLAAALDGLPLAMELAAARANVLTPAQILDRIERDAALLETREVDVPERHRSIRDTVAWSYGLLTPDQQATLRGLSVFRGGATMSALEFVAGRDVLDDLSELVDRSLVRTSSAISAKRFDLPHGVSRFAAEQLDVPESTELQERHTTFFCDRGATAEQGLLGERASWWLATLEDDHENLHVALGRSLETGDISRGFDLLGSIWRYYHSAGRLGEVSLWLDRFFQLPGSDQRSAPLARGLMARGAVEYWRGESENALRDYRLAVDIATETAYKNELAGAHFGVVTSLFALQRYDKFLEELEVTRQLYEELDDAWGRAHVTTFKAFHVLLTQGYAAAVEPVTEAMRLWEKAGNRKEAAGVTLGLAVGAFREGELEVGVRHTIRGLDLAEQAGDMFTAVGAVEVIANGLIANDEIETGALLAGASAAARERMGGGFTIPSFLRPPGIAEALEDEQAQEMMARGEDLSLEEAIEIVRSM